MKFFHFPALIISAILLTSCATTTTTSQYRKISPDEAFSFERAQAKGNSALPQESKPLYVQPVNKTEPCKLPTSQDQLDRNNFRAYWDGQCKAGFAHGLGRDIAISDTHHIEEITIHGDNGNYSDSPSVTYDFVHHNVSYRFFGDTPSTYTIFQEQIANEQGNFNVVYRLGEVENQDAKIISWSPFSSRKILENYSGNVIYKYTIDEIIPNNITNPIFVAETIGRSSGISGGFAAVRYANGQVVHFKVGSGQPELVQLPQEYISMIEKKYKEIENTQNKASNEIEKAKRMEREYLYLACNGKHEISGLENEISNEICTWREQFQEPFKLAQKQYSENLERMKIEARSQEEQRKIQEQLDYQKRMVQAAENQANAAARQASAAENANFQNSLNRYKTTTCFTNFGITTCY